MSESATLSLQERWLGYAQAAESWLRNDLLTVETGTIVTIQLAVVIAALLAGRWIGRGLYPAAERAIKPLPEGMAAGLAAIFKAGLSPTFQAGLLGIGVVGLGMVDQPAAIVRIAFGLAGVWLLIRTTSLFIKNQTIRIYLRRIALVIAGLYAIGVLDDIMDWLNRTGISFGGKLVTLPFVFQAVVMTALFVWAAGWLAGQMQRRIETLPKVEPSLRILFANGVRVSLFILAALLVMTGLGIDLSALAILGGAIGVGLGFGMQQIVANFVSGVILLTDRSIKPNDVIEVDETYGVVKSLGLRYCSVITRDGKEHLIPNEMLVTDKVVNWSYSDEKVRIKRRVRVEYETDLRLAVGLVIEACGTVDRVLKDPAPNCLVMEFGEQAVELEARFWISDPAGGINNVGSAVMLAVWDKFKAHGIDIPLRREEILIEPGSVIDVRLKRED
jgi:small-conductance mechanosensitive channel